MGTLLPPVEDDRTLRRVLALVPSGLRDDAIQEAWVAHLEGRDVIQSIDTFRVKELRHAKRQVSIVETEDGEQVAVDRNGKLHDLATPSRKSQSAAAATTAGAATRRERVA